MAFNFLIIAVPNIYVP